MHRPYRAAACAAAVAILGVYGCHKSAPATASNPPAAPAAGKTSASRTYDIKDAEGHSTRLAVSGPSGPVSTPGFAPVYPGGKVQQSITGASGTGAGGLVIFRTPASSDEVLAFYRDKAAKAGLVNVVSTQSGTGRSFTAGKDGSEEGLQVTATPDKGETYVVLTWTGSKRG